MKNFRELTWALIFLVIVTFVSPGMLHSDELNPTGRDVLTDCSLALDMAQNGYIEKLVKTGKPVPTTDQQNRANQCLNYVVGFKDALYVSQIYHEKNGLTPFMHLPENNINNETALRVVIRYIQGNSQLLDQPEAAVVFNAFYNAFASKK